MHIRYALLMAGVAFAVVPGAAMAVEQDTETPADQPAGRASTMQQDKDGDVIVVTATKREMDVQDVPISIQVVGQKQLEQANLSDLLSLSRQVPGFDVRTTNAGNSMRLRGFGSTQNNAVEQTVALYKDGIFQGKSRQNQVPFFDIARIEVLRGPQGALIGKNSAAGAVSIISNGPTSAFEGSVTGNYLISRQGYDIYGFLSGPLDEKISARLAAKVKHSRGNLRNFATGKREPDAQSQQLRLSIKAEPTDGLASTLKIEYSNQESEGFNFIGVPAASVQSYAQTLNAIKQAGGYSKPTLNGQVGLEKHRQLDISNTLTAEIGTLDFTSITGFTHYDSYIRTFGRHAGPAETIITIFDDEFRQFSQEVRLQSPGGETFDWVIGGYADWSHQLLENPTTFATPVSATNLTTLTRDAQMRTIYDSSAQSYSAYATGTLRLSDALSVVAGARYTTVRREGSLRLVADYLRVGTLPNVPFSLRDTITDNSFDPSLSVQYHVRPDVMLYANVGRGSKPGTLQGTGRTVTAADFRLKQERSTSYEIGIKSEWGRLLQFNANAFYVTMSNYQVGQYIEPSPNTPPILRATNAAKVSSRGAELQTTLRLHDYIDGLQFSLTGAYIDARFDDYPGATCTAAATAAGCASGFFTTPAGRVAFNAKGLPLQQTSRWSGTLSFDYSRDIGEKLKLQLAGSADMFSSYYFDISTYNPVTGLQPGDTQFNLRVALSDRDDRWSVAFIGENLNDVYRAGNTFLFPGQPGTVAVYGIYGGRNLQLQTTLRF